MREREREEKMEWESSETLHFNYGKRFFGFEMFSGSAHSF
jgi:hypothetical protein